MKFHRLGGKIAATVGLLAATLGWFTTHKVKGFADFGLWCYMNPLQVLGNCLALLLNEKNGPCQGGVLIASGTVAFFAVQRDGVIFWGILRGGAWKELVANFLSHLFQCQREGNPVRRKMGTQLSVTLPPKISCAIETTSRLTSCTASGSMRWGQIESTLDTGARLIPKHFLVAPNQKGGKKKSLLVL